MQFDELLTPAAGIHSFWKPIPAAAGTADLQSEYFADDDIDDGDVDDDDDDVAFDEIAVSTSDFT